MQPNLKRIDDLDNCSTQVQNIINTIAGVNTRFKSMQFDYKKHQPWAEHLSIVMQIGLTMAGCIIFCFFIGLALDKWIGTRGIFVAIFTVLGVIGGAVTVYRQIIEITEEKKDHREDDNNS